MGKKLRLLTFLFLAVMIWSVPAWALQIGDQIPNYELKDLEGNSVEITDFEGDYVLFDVWATWCKYCIEAFEDYQANMDQFEEAGIKIVGISTDAQFSTLTKFLEETPLPFTVVHDRYNTASRKWGVRGIPATFLVNPKGKVIKATIGLKPFDQFMAEMKEAIEVDKNPLVAAKKLKVDSYPMTLVNLDYREIREKLEKFPIEFGSRPVIPMPQFEHKKDPEFEGTPLYAYIPFLYERQLYSFTSVDLDKDKAADVVYFDQNMNLDFTDDGEPLKLKPEKDRNGKPLNALELVLPVKIQKEITVNYHMAAYFSKMWSGYYVVPMQGFETKIDSDLGELRTLLIDADSNGVMTDEKDMIFIDLNGNGRFDSFSGQEWVNVGESLVINGEEYQINILPNDKEIVLELAK